MSWSTTMIYIKNHSMIETRRLKADVTFVQKMSYNSLNIIKFNV